MPSITYWNRLEPRPRSRSLAEPLAARIRDPLWMLTRQWQLGELRGEDAGSPAHVEMQARLSRPTSWRPTGGTGRPLGTGAPLEELVETEPFTPDLAVRVELGQTFEWLLDGTGAAGLIADFRAAYPIPAEPEASAASPDQARARFLRVCAERAVDGVALVRAARQSRPALPPLPAVAPADQAAVGEALDRLQAWVAELYGDLGEDDAPAWRPERLAYSVEVMAPLPVGGTVRFDAHPDRDGEFGWDAFDVQEMRKPARPDEDRKPIRRSVQPTHVRFRGMPNARWWEFERGDVDLGAVAPDRRGLAHLVVMSFMLVHGNDWFLIPFEQPVGTLCAVESLVVHDVFGGRTLVERADAATTAGERPWTMFSTSREDTPKEIADFFLLPPSATVAMQAGPTLEEVRFIRDEMANMVWAIEHTTENGIGEPWPGHERSAAAPPPPPAPPADTRSALRYRIQTTVPEHWIPCLPVAIDPARGEIALERSAMLRPDTLEPIEPRGRILRPSGLGPAPFRIREEEVPRGGRRVSRVVRRSRWTDGSTHLWIARRTTAGGGEGWSGLRFDLAEPNA